MKKYLTLLLSSVLCLGLISCGAQTPKDKAEENQVIEENQEVEENQVIEENQEVEESQDTGFKINYLGQEYAFDKKVENVVLASLEGMEDAAALGIDAVGVLEVAGEVPSYLKEDFKDVTLVGDKRTPNPEVILGLDPDVIVGTSKWNEELMAQMNKIAVTLPYSHISSNWKANILALAEITGKTEEANKLVSDYEAKITESKNKLAKGFVDQTILVIRVRAGLMNIYPADTYLNPVLYTDLGLKVPEVLSEAKAQAELTVETLAQVNPDVIFLQFETSENPDNPGALDELLADPIFNSTNAAKNEKVFVNTIEPLAQGGTAWSKVKFLDAAVESLLK